MLNPVAAAIPVFFALIGVEAAYAWRRGLRVYRLNDALTDLGCGVVDQVGSVFLEGVLLSTYFYVYEYHRVLYHAFGDSLGMFLVASVGVDFSYYWWHRASHRVNFIWATHVVHHQSDEYNLAVALRQAVFAGLTSWPFYLWLAALGVPPVTYVGARAFNLLYQFWIHTRVIDKLGPLESFLNTPSHHRVHHGVNAAYIDKNYAGVLIIWDKLFGTFEPEVEPVIYGTVTPFQSWNPVWAQLEPWQKLAQRVFASGNPGMWIEGWFKPPEWVPRDQKPLVFPTDDELAARAKYDVDAPGYHLYALAQWVPIAVAVTGLLLYAHDVETTPLAAVGAWVLVSLVALAGLLESKPWAVPLEIGRQLALIGLAGAGAVLVHPAAMLLGVWALVSLPVLATRVANPPSSAPRAA